VSGVQVDGSQGEGGSHDGVKVTDDNAAMRRLGVASRTGTVSVALNTIRRSSRLKRQLPVMTGQDGQRRAGVSRSQRPVNG
jgi:hypothetical protein